MNLIEELKEIVSENKESNYEFTSIISHQRQEIENLKRILEDNNLEVCNANKRGNRKLDETENDDRYSTDSLDEVYLNGYMHANTSVGYPITLV